MVAYFRKRRRLLIMVGMQLLLSIPFVMAAVGCTVQDSVYPFQLVGAFKSKDLWISVIILIFAASAVGVFLFLWNKTRKRKINEKTAALEVELKERIRMEADLKSLQVQLSKALEVARLGYWEYDAQKDLFLFNDQFYKIFGTTCKQVGGYSISSSAYADRFLHPDDRSMVGDEVKSSMEALDPDFTRHLEHRIIRADGSIGHIGVHFYIVKDADGRTVKTYGINQDITERIQAENRLRESESKFRDVVSSVPGAVYQFVRRSDGSIEIPFMSDGASTILNLPSGKFRDADSLFGQIVPEDLHGMWASIHQSAETMQPWQHQFRIVSDTGDTKWLRGVANPRLLPDGSVSWTGVILDISDQVRAAEALNKSEQLYRALFEQNLNPIAILGLDGNYLDANQSFLKFVERSKEELLGMNAFDFEPPEQKELQRRKHLPIWETGGTIEAEYFIHDKTKILELTYTPISYKHKEALIGIGRDITDRKRLEARLNQSQKMEAIGTLAGGIAHDFNNILFPIVGMAELLLEDLAPEGEPYQNVREILKAGKRGSDLVRQILTFGRQTDRSMMPLRIQHVLKEALKLMRATIPSYVDIEQNIRDDCGLVMANATQIHQIAMNLVTNAYHAVEHAGGRIFVELTETYLGLDDLITEKAIPGHYVRLSVADTGAGIDPAVLDKIFDPYFTTKKQGNGTGLGLSVVYGIVQEHQGMIHVYSEVGKGTAFNVYLPLLDRSAQVPEMENRPDIQRGDERILLVDDEEAVVKVEKSMLERFGYRVTTKSGSVEALELFKAAPADFDLVISDMTMPNMTGDQLSKALIAIRPDTPIILCTGFSARLNPEEAKASGIMGYLMKPVALTEMIQMVRHVLDGHQNQA